MLGLDLERKSTQLDRRLARRSPMKTLQQHLTQYAGYHRDPRNIATHFVGIPMIVLAVQILTARPALELGGLALLPMHLVALGAMLFYLRLDLRFAVAMAAFLAPGLWIAPRLAAESTGVWLGAGLGMFFVGWVFQFVGHYFEGKKPAFVDDLVGLLVGPLFVVAELGFMLGLRAEVKQHIEAEVGPTRVRTGPAAA
jgi:uncharacterized membrane protein YGL010W